MARLPSVLSAVALGLGLIVAYEIVAPIVPIGADPSVQAQPVAVAAPVLARFTPPPKSDFDAVNARALFDPARQRVDEPAAMGAASATPPDVSLVGVAIGAGRAVALLKRSNVKAALSVRVGDSVDGWQVDRIAPDHVTLKNGVTTYDVTVRQAAGLSPPNGQQQ